MPEEVAELKALEAVEALSELNRHGTREEFHLPPGNETHMLLLQHYIDSGRAQALGEIYGALNFWGTGQELGRDPNSLPFDERVRALFGHYRKFHPEASPFTMLDDAIAFLAASGSHAAV